MKIGYFAPSYKRPEKSITQKNYPFIKLVVCESQSEEYLLNGNDIIICPDNAQGNISRIRNWIKDNLMNNFDAIIMIDDDNNGIGIWQKQKYKILNSDELQEFCENIAIMCNDFGFKSFGLNCVIDKGAYMEHTPFSTNKFIGAPFHGILKGNKCIYDESIPLKEDYDWTLQNLKKYKGVLRINFASYHVKQAEQIGGCANMRNIKEEEKQFNLLQSKWGNKIIQKDNKSKRKFDFNPILKTPLKGV
jgi:hypothetical protein